MKKIVHFLATALLLATTSTFSFSQAADLFISEVAEGTADNKYLEIYNGTGAAVDLGNYSLSSCANGCNTFNEFDFPDNVTFAAGTMLADGDVYIIAHPDADATILAVADQTFMFLSNGDDAWALTQAGATATNYTILDLVGDLQGDPGSGWAVAGVGNGTQDQTLVRKAAVCQGNPNELASFGTGPMDSEWDLLPQNDWTNLNTHTSSCLGSGPGPLPCAELFFSEYIEGSADNIAFEIYNPTGSAIDLSDYIVYRNDDGAATSSASFTLSGMLTSGDVYVVANASASAGILAEQDATNAIASYTGNDALYLVKISTDDTLDIIGEIGIDPGTNWTVGSGATSDYTLVRMSSVQQGSTDWTVGATEWLVFAQDIIDSLGAHTSSCIVPCSPTSSSITEIACETYTAPDGMMYSASGTYTATITNAQGCDSIITIDLTINTSTMSTLNEIVCDSFALNGTTYTFSGTYTQTLTNAVGCDSIVTLILDVTTTPVVPTVNGTLDYCDGDTPTALTASGGAASDSLIISGVLDASLPGGLPKGVEFYVLEDIADLSAYGFGSANNGQGTDGEEFTFPAVPVTAGTYIHVATDSANFNTFIGFFPDYVAASAANINGDDAIELFHNSVVIDVFGDINTDGTGEPWEYADGWAYRKDNAVPNGGNFILGEWDFSGVDALDNQATNAGAPNPFPIETYMYTPQVSTINWYDDAALTNMVGTGNSFTPGITSGSISYYVTATNSGGTTCPSAATQVDITFNAPPAVVANASATDVCEGESVTLTGSGAATYQWNNGATDGVAFAVTATTTYTVTGTDQFGCTAVDSVEITVTAAPATTLAAQPTVCDSDAAFTLSGGTPAGGTYSGTGVSNGDFDPSVAGAGTFTITYSYLDTTSGCTGTATADLIVNDCASIAELEAEGILVYPNPATDVLNVQTVSDIKTIEVVDLSGMIVANGTENTVSVANLASGIYVINVTTETGMFAKTFVKK